MPGAMVTGSATHSFKRPCRAVDAIDLAGSSQGGRSGVRHAAPGAVRRARRAGGGQALQHLGGRRALDGRGRHHRRRAQRCGHDIGLLHEV